MVLIKHIGVQGVLMAVSGGCISI